MMYGTHHFIDYDSAVNYYQQYSPDLPRFEVMLWVDNKLKEGEIAIGPPKLTVNQKLFVLGSEGRYAIKEN